METLERDSYYLTGLVLLRQEYRAIVSELESADGLTKPQLDLLLVDLADEHRLRCAQEYKAIRDQLRADQGVQVRLFAAR